MYLLNTTYSCWLRGLSQVPCVHLEHWLRTSSEINTMHPQDAHEQSRQCGDVTWHLLRCLTSMMVLLLLFRCDLRINDIDMSSLDHPNLKGLCGVSSLVCPVVESSRSTHSGKERMWTVMFLMQLVVCANTWLKSKYEPVQYNNVPLLLPLRLRENSNYQVNIIISNIIKCRALPKQSRLCLACTLVAGFV